MNADEVRRMHLIAAFLSAQIAQQVDLIFEGARPRSEARRA